MEEKSTESNQTKDSQPFKLGKEFPTKGNDGRVCRQYIELLYKGLWYLTDRNYWNLEPWRRMGLLKRRIAFSKRERREKEREYKMNLPMLEMEVRFEVRIFELK